MVEKNKGGRPVIKHKKDQQLSTQVSLLERKIIENQAKKCLLTVSEYLRDTGLYGKISIKFKTLPKDVLQLTGTLNHTAANINQIAFQLNSQNLLTESERIKLEGLIEEIKEVVKIIREVLTYDR